MNKQKLSYQSPVTETLVVRFEGVICQSLNLVFGALNAAGNDLGLDDAENNYGDF